MNNKISNPICALLWEDAHYTYEQNLPAFVPLPRLTVGFIIETNDAFTKIATQVEYNPETKQLTPSDGFIIPEKSILDFKKIGEYDPH